MAGYKIQLKDKDGNMQYPVTTPNLVVGSDGKSVEQRLRAVEQGNSGGNKTPVLESWEDYNTETSRGYALGANLGYEYIKGVSDILDEINGSTVVAVDEINGEII